MKTDDLLILLEVARCGSFLRAAPNLGFDYSTVSRRISALERELKAPLVNRDVNGCTLTSLGESLLASCEQIESAVNEAKRLSQSPDSPKVGLSGLVRVATTEAFGAYVVTPILANIHRQNPRLQVEILTQTRSNPYSAGADIEIGVGAPVTNRPNAEFLTEYRLGLYATDAYLQSMGPPRSIKDLGFHSLIYYVEGLLRIDDLDVLGQFTSANRAAFASTSPHAQMQATLSGAGIGLLPSFMAEPNPLLSRVLFEEVSVFAEFSSSMAADRLRRPATVHVMNSIRAEVSRRQSLLVPPK